jgi:hypothetical protein
VSEFSRCGKFDGASFTLATASLRNTWLIRKAVNLLAEGIILLRYTYTHIYIYIYIHDIYVA